MPRAATQSDSQLRAARNVKEEAKHNSLAVLFSLFRQPIINVNTRNCSEANDRCHVMDPAVWMVAVDAVDDDGCGVGGRFGGLSSFRLCQCMK